MRARFAWMAIGAACAALGCTATTPPTFSKDEASERIVTGAADGIDFCEEHGWYGDGECDEFCPLYDQDCTGGECTVLADSTCPDGESCIPGVCPGCTAENWRTCCSPAHCVLLEADFCPRARCASGTRCDEELDECVPDEDGFCARALCGPGTRCDEHLDRCVPSDDFCPRVRCAPGTRCDEEANACVLDEEGFCTTALCGPGTRCDEELDACVPLAGCREIGCARHCEHGFQIGPDGCPTCDCNEAPVACHRAGCSGRLCVPEGLEPVLTTCMEHADDVCYDIGTCEMQPTGYCGWTTTPEFAECFERTSESRAD